MLFCCAGDEVDDKEEVTRICEEGDDDDPENRYLNNKLQRYSPMGIKTITEELYIFTFLSFFIWLIPIQLYFCSIVPTAMSQYCDISTDLLCFSQLSVCLLCSSNVTL